MSEDGFNQNLPRQQDPANPYLMQLRKNTGPSPTLSNMIPKIANNLETSVKTRNSIQTPVKTYGLEGIQNLASQGTKRVNNKNLQTKQQLNSNLGKIQINDFKNEQSNDDFASQGNPMTRNPRVKSQQSQGQAAPKRQKLVELEDPKVETHKLSTISNSDLQKDDERNVCNERMILEKVQNLCKEHKKKPPSNQLIKIISLALNEHIHRFLEFASDLSKRRYDSDKEKYHFCISSNVRKYLNDVKERKYQNQIKSPQPTQVINQKRQEEKTNDLALSLASRRHKQIDTEKIMNSVNKQNQDNSKRAITYSEMAILVRQNANMRKTKLCLQLSAGIRPFNRQIIGNTQSNM